MPKGAEERAADVALVERTLSLIQKHHAAVDKSVRVIGEHLFVHYFGGKEEVVRSKRPRKDKSYALLAKRAEGTSFGPRQLRRALVIAVAYRSLPIGVRSKLEVSHLEVLGAIADRKARVELARRIARGELRGGALKRAIAQRGGKERAGGHAPKVAVVDLADDVEKMFRDAKKSGGLQGRALSRIPAPARARVAERLEAVAKTAAELARRLRAAR